MALWSLCVLACILASGLCDPINVIPNIESIDFVKKQIDVSLLYFHALEPNHDTKCMTISSTWSFEENLANFKNETAVNIWMKMKKNNWLLPRSMPFTILNPMHQYEAVVLFNALYSAKDYDTYYKSAVYVKDRVNQDLFVYVLNALNMHRSDLKGFVIPPLYECLPEYFNNAEILTTAQRIGIHGERMIEYYPSTYKWDNSIVVRWNSTIWPYNCQSSPMFYYLNDYGLNAHYYYSELANPNWFEGDALLLSYDRRGEWFWFMHKQIWTRYYMERLSNGLGEVDDLDDDFVHEGYNSGYMYHSGIPYPVRPNHFHLSQPEHVVDLDKIKDYERRIRDAIESGFIKNAAGERVDIRSPKAIDILGRLIEGGVSSPNVQYYKDFISIWKSLLGNSVWHEHSYSRVKPYVVPSALEHYQTALSDPAFYMIWKRVLNLFSLWQHQLPEYTNEELALPGVTIEKVDVDKLVTFFEYTYMNISAYIHMDDVESKLVFDKESVLVQYPRLNHKKFNVRIHVASEVAKKVMVRLFLAPKYDSRGLEIPLHANSENFFLLDHFVQDLTPGKNLIIKESTQNSFTVNDLRTANDVYFKAIDIAEGKKDFIKDPSEHIDYFPHRLLMPKGRVGGMPFVLMVYVSEINPVQTSIGTSEADYDSRLLSNDRFGFPVDRPLNPWQIAELQNIYFADVQIHHKPTPEIIIPYTM